MADSDVRTIPSKIFGFFRNMKKGDRTRLIVLVGVVILIIIAVSIFLNQKSYTTLYSGMDPAEAGEVMALLSEMGVDAISQGEDTILVAEDQVDNARMQLAGQGYPNSGVNFEIFQNASGLGVTDMEKQVYYQFQLQENLRQTIRQMDKIEDAAVNINMPEESAFVLSDNEKPATAAVMLTLQGSSTISDTQVRAIAELVSKSVSGLQLDDVRILDSTMKLYSIQEEDAIENVGSQVELQHSTQNRLQTQIINLLTPVFGDGNVLAEVNVSLNFDTKITESTVFTSPTEDDEGLAISVKELTETINSDTSGGGAGVDANGGITQYVQSGDDDAAYQTISKEANYEINETKTQIEDAKGQIEDLSVSVILNSEENYDDYTDNVIKLVANAIGVDAERITVEMLPFKVMEESSSTTDVFVAQQEMLSSVQQQSTVRLIIMLVAGLIVLIILVSIIRLFKSGSRGTRAVGADGQEMAWDGEGIELVADEEITPSQVQGDINFDNKNNTVTVLEDYIDQNPESVANLLRNWLNDDYN